MATTDVSSNVASTVAGEIARREYGAQDLGVITRNLVQTGWQQAQTYASQSFSSANSALGSLANAAAGVATIPTVDSSLTAIGVAAATLTAFSEAYATTAPAMTFTDQNYSSSEFTHLLAQIDLWVQGDYTGLPPAIEQALWDRARAREVVAANKKSQEVLRQFAARGFSKPPGALAVQLLEATQEAQDKDSSFSRDVAIKQADLIQANRRFAFEMAEKIQASLIVYMRDKMARALEVAKVLAQLVSEADAHRAQAYGARAGYAGARVSAEAQVQRASADVQIATANLRIEAAKTNVQALIEKARLLMEAIRATAQISGQLAASALSAVNLSGGLHDSTSWGVSISDARSRSVSVGESASSNRQENYTP